MIKNIIVLILILAFVGVVVFLDMPKVQKILDLRRQIKEEKEKFSEKQILLAKIEKLVQLYEENKENFEKINDVLPFNQDIPNLIVQLEALAFENGLVLEDITLTPTEKETAGRAKEVRTQEEKVSKDYQILAVNFKLIGDYLAFKNFLKTVEENMRLMDIISISFSLASGEGVQIFNFDLNLKTYYQ